MVGIVPDTWCFLSLSLYVLFVNANLYVYENLMVPFNSA